MSKAGLCDDKMEKRTFCCVIPVFANTPKIHEVIRRLRTMTKQILVIDNATALSGDPFRIDNPEINVLSLPERQSLGGLFRAALNNLASRGISCMVLLDPEGQCYPEDLPRFLSYLQKTSRYTITIGCRDFYIPEKKKNRINWRRRIANFLFRLETGLKTTDALSNYFLLPVHCIKRLSIPENSRDFYTELLTRAAWANLNIRSLRVRFSPNPEIPERRISITTHLKLILRSLVPCWRQTLCAGEKTDFSLFHPKQFFSHMLKENATPGELAGAAFTGTYCAVLPLFGLHTPVVLYFATIFKLNKFLAFMIQHPFVLLPVTPFLCIELGHFMRNGEWLTDFNLQTLGCEIVFRAWEWLLGSLVLAPVFATLAAIITYFSAVYLQKKIRLKFWASSRKRIRENESTETTKKQ